MVSVSAGIRLWTYALEPEIVFLDLTILSLNVLPFLNFLQKPKQSFQEISDKKHDFVECKTDGIITEVTSKFRARVNFFPELSRTTESEIRVKRLSKT